MPDAAVPTAHSQTQPPANDQSPVGGILGPVTILVRTAAAIPSDKLVLLALIAVVGVLLYGFVWVIPAAHSDAIGVIQSTNDAQRELDRRARQEESESERRERREQSEKLRATIMTENEKTRETHSRDTEKLRTEFRQGIDEIRRTKSGGGFRD